jgi:signal transduction histidine kinase
VVTPNAVDAAYAATFLREGGIETRAFESIPSMAAELDDATGCLILVDDALVERDIPALQEALERMPAWCDLPLIVVSRNVAAVGPFIAGAFPTSGNVTYLERPLNPHSLVSAARMALRASARQRQVGELMAQREHEVRLRDEFLAMLAHELRNPLAPMRNALYILRKVKIQDPLVVKNTEILSRQVDHVVHLVDDLMDVARLEHGKVILKKQRLDLNGVVAAAVESCQPGVQDRGHHVTVRLEPGAIAVDGDPVRHEQIVCNLLTNAAKFSPKSSEIRVHTALEPGSGLISVEDQGVGFDAAAADQLFAPFLQFNSTIDRSSGGLGMGLTIVKRLAELHGGAVRAFSAGPGKGARFEIRIPLAEGAPVDDPAPAQAAPVTSKPRRVAVIEDNPDILETMHMLLKLWGHEVAMASDGPAGLELVLRERPDIALIDVGLPGMSGYDLARRIRQRLPAGSVRLIAITGYGQPSDREMAGRAGFDAHLLKPINPETLEGLLAAST